MSQEIWQKQEYFSWLINNLFGEAQPHLHFWVLTVIILGSSIGVVSARNLVHAAMFLALSFIGVAGIFVLLNAPLLAAIQVLVYAGGIVTLMIFAIMLSEGIANKKIISHNRQSVTAMGVAVAMALVMVGILLYSREGYFVGHLRWWVTPERNEFPNIDNAVLIGRSLMTTYTLAFWVASIILTIAMIGALILTRSEKDMPLEPGEVVNETTPPETEPGTIEEVTSENPETEAAE